jgi:hypothetical protein
MDLRVFYDTKREFFENRELYLLRNMSRGQGIGFFEAGNFYPDFILWLLDGGKQYVTFVDPKGSATWKALIIRRFVSTVRPKSSKRASAIPT